MLKNRYILEVGRQEEKEEAGNEYEEEEQKIN